MLLGSKPGYRQPEIDIRDERKTKTPAHHAICANAAPCADL